MCELQTSAKDPPAGGTVGAKMSRTRRALLSTLLAAWPLSVSAQQSPAAEPTDPGAVIVEAGTPVPVPLDGVVERLRAELPAVPIEVGPLPGSVTAGAATVSLGLTADGRMHVIYRDANGREASRIVADTSDPQAVAAAIAMIVANLHRSQVDAALAAIGPAAVPAAPAPPPPPPPVAAAAASAPHARVVVVDVRRSPHHPPRAPVAARTAVTPDTEPTWALWLAPTADAMGDWMYGLELGGELRFGDYRLEVALSHAPPLEMGRTVADGGWADAFYDHYLGTLRVRRLLPLGGRVSLGGAAGIGFLISEHTDMFVGDEFWGSRSDLDFVVSTGASLDVRLLGQTLYWTTRIDAVLTTASDSDYHPFTPGLFGHMATGLRLAI